MEVTVLKSRIAYLGGLERYAQTIAKAFAKQGAKTTLLTTGEPISIPGVNVISLGKHPKSTLRSIEHFNRLAKEWLEKHPQDCVFGLDRNRDQTHYRAGNGLHATFLKQKHPSQMGYILSKWKPKNRLILKKEKQLFLSSKLKKLFTNSEMVKQDLISTYGVKKETIEVVHNGVDFNHYVLDPKQIQRNQSKVSMLFVGHNYKRKGLNLILKAMHLLADPTLHLHVVGADKRVSHYQKEVKRLNLNEQVTFWGAQKDLRQFYLQSDIFILPTAYDPFANVTIEALAMGQYVITSRYNGGAEVLSSSTGYTLNDLSDLSELMEAIKTAKTMPQDDESKMKRRASIEHLDINAQINKIVNLTMNTTQ